MLPFGLFEGEENDDKKIVVSFLEKVEYIRFTNCQRIFLSNNKMLGVVLVKWAEITIYSHFYSLFIHSVNMYYLY